MPWVDLTKSSLMTPLMTSNVLSIGPLDGGGVEDEDLKAGVAPSNQEKDSDSIISILINN